MKRTRLADAPCPIARSLDAVGDWWTLLILRDAMRGSTRFDEFQRGVGLATNMLARRLRALVEAGLLERRPYQQRPLRHEYRLTDKGHDFLPVLLAMAEWGNRWLMPEGAFRLVCKDTGATVRPLLVDRDSGRPVTVEWIAAEMMGDMMSDTDTQHREDVR